MKRFRLQDLSSRIAGAVVVALLLITAQAAQALTVHGDLAGSTVDFFGITEDSATDATPLYGAPSAFGDTLVFFPSAFVSSSSEGSSDVTEGTLTVTVTAHHGFIIEKVSLFEQGDWTLSGVGTSDTFVDVSGSLSLEDLTFATGSYSDPLAVLPPGYHDLTGGAGGGLFSGSAVVDLVGLGLVGVKSVDLTFTNVLESGSEAGTSALIQKKVVGDTTLTIYTGNGGPVIPEPSTFAIWSLLGIAMVGGRWWRRRRGEAA